MPPALHRGPCGSRLFLQTEVKSACVCVGGRGASHRPPGPHPHSSVESARGPAVTAEWLRVDAGLMRGLGLAGRKLRGGENRVWERTSFGSAPPLGPALLASARLCAPAPFPCHPPPRLSAPPPPSSPPPGGSASPQGSAPPPPGSVLCPPPSAPRRPRPHLRLLGGAGPPRDDKAAAAGPDCRGDRPGAQGR